MFRMQCPLKEYIVTFKIVHHFVYFIIGYCCGNEKLKESPSCACQEELAGEMKGLNGLLLCTGMVGSWKA